MFSQNLARIAIIGLFLAYVFEGNGQIFYPNAASVNDFHVGDTLNVSLVNPYGSARLLLYCSYETNPRDVETVPSQSTSPISLVLREPSPNCYLELSEDPDSYLTSVIFSVSPSNDTVRVWSLASQSEGQPSPAMVSSAAALPPTVTSVPMNGSVAIARPNITLPDDGPDDMYILADQTHCLVIIGSSLHQGCWEALNLNQWLPEWFKETRKCPDQSSDVNCQSQAPEPEAWTSTFLREYGMTNEDCRILDRVIAECHDYHVAPFTPDESPLLTARFEYVKFNIVAIAQYFSAWYLALKDAASTAKDAIGPIINLIDIPKKHKSRIAVNVFLTILGAALSLIPFVGPEAGLGALSLLAANAAIEGVKQVPDLAKTLWPAGEENTVGFQIDSLTDLFSNGLLASLESNFEDLLSIVQGFRQPDTSAFLAFAGQGTFSIPAIQGPAAGAASSVEKDILKQSMTTFLVSVALAQNGWQALLVPGVDAEGLYHGDTACPNWASPECDDDEDTMGCHSHDYTDQCQGTYWWHSVEHNSMYTLIQDGKLDNDATNLLVAMFQSNWTTGPLLFENAAKCELQNLLLAAQNQTYTYVYDNTTRPSGGFIYNTSIPGLDPSYQQSPPLHSNYNASSFFLPISGDGLVELSKLSNVHDAQYHPISNPFTPQTTGVVDESCVSDLNVTIATSWGRKNNWQ